MIRTLLLFLSLGLTSVASAQFNIVSTSISNGQVNVALQDTLWITFNKAIKADTNLGGFPGSTYIRYMYAPMESNAPRTPVLKAGGTVLGFPLSLQANKIYTYSVNFAVSTLGEPLQRPISVRFSTGAMTNAGSIRGKVTLAEGAAASNLTVVAYPDWAHSARSLEELPQGVVSVATTDAEGNYALGLLPDGNFMIRAFRPGNTRLPAFGQDGFMIGFFDRNNDRFPDPVQINRAARLVENINITVHTPVPIISSTAESRDSAAVIARRRNQDAKLVSLTGIGSMDSLGRTAGWLYLYRNESARRDFALLMTGNRLVLGIDAGSTGEHFVAVPPNFSNSSVVANSIKPAIRALNPTESPLVLASLTTMNYSSNGSTTPPAPKWNISVTYKNAAGQTRMVMYALDAVSGTVTAPLKLTAIAASDSVAKFIARLASPVQLDLVSISGNVDTSGKAEVWSILYYNYAAKAFASASVDGRGTVRMDTRTDKSPYQPPKLRGTWLDSPAILDSSRVWKQYVANNPQARGFVSLKTVIFPFPADTVTMWSISAQGGSPNNGSITQPGGLVFENLVASTGKPYVPLQYLAFDESDNAIAKAKEWKSDAALIRIGAAGVVNVSNSGKTGMWNYQFVSDSRRDSVLNMLVAGSATKSSFFVRRLTDRDTIKIPTLPALSGLLNSDRAVEIAEMERGTDFRANNPDQNVNASLDQVRVKRDSTLSLWSVAYPFANATTIGHHRVIINAATGEVIREKTRTTERAPFETAFKAAQEWSRDAQLRYAKADSISSDGLVEVWLFGFWSFVKKEALFVEVTGGTTITNQWVSTTVPQNFAKGRPIVNWLESAQALALAYAALGSQANQPGAIQNISGELTNSSNALAKPSETTLAATDADFWAFRVVKSDGHVTQVTVTDEGTTTTDAERVGNALPSSLALEQNFPNPFNPSTTIRYSVPVAGKVSLDVYNLIGQRVASIVNGVQTAGMYEVSFDASKLSSGMYFYRLSAGSQTMTRRMTLLK